MLKNFWLVTYQAGTGAVLNGMLGVNYDLYKFISGFVEYKLTYADVEDDLKGGGTINTETVNHQIIFGYIHPFRFISDWAVG